MGSETSREEEVSSHPNGSQMDSIDVATYEAEMSKMREISRMDRAIRTRLQHGVKYNMRIVICGDKATGKTLLWKRFQGQAFETEVRTHFMILTIWPIPFSHVLYLTCLLDIAAHTHARDTGENWPFQKDTVYISTRSS